MKKKIFQYRGTLFVPAALVMLILGKITLQSLITGLLISFVIGEGIRIWAVGYSGTTTRSDQLKAPELVTAGPYAHLRNPLYLGNLISWLGFCVAATGATAPWVTGLIFGLVILSNIIIYGVIIPLEEEFLEGEFGDTYREYVKSVPRLFPRFTPYEKPNGVYKPEVILKAESQTIIMLLGITAILVLKFVHIIP